MQVNNNPQLPQAASFGMALKITPAAREALEKASMETIQKLQKAGEELKDTKYYHLEIGKDLTPRIDFWGADAYIPAFKIKPPAKYDNSFSVDMVYDGAETLGYKKGQKIGKLLEFVNEEAAKAGYEKLHNMHSDIDRAVEITKLLDNKQIAREKERAAKRSEQEKIKVAVDKLFEMFGGNTHVK